MQRLNWLYWLFLFLLVTWLEDVRGPLPNGHFLVALEHLLSLLQFLFIHELCVMPGNFRKISTNEITHVSILFLHKLNSFRSRLKSGLTFNFIIIITDARYGLSYNFNFCEAIVENTNLISKYFFLFEMLTRDQWFFHIEIALTKKWIIRFISNNP